MKPLPENLRTHHRTHTFTRDTIPAGLLGEHLTKDGTWGKIVVLSGAITYHISGVASESMTLTPQHYGVIEPKMPHRVEPVGEVEFYVEFFR